MATLFNQTSWRNGRHLAPALCCRIIFNDQVRQNVTDETDILTLSNDAWFGRSIGPFTAYGNCTDACSGAWEATNSLYQQWCNGSNGSTKRQDHQTNTAVLKRQYWKLNSTDGSRTPYHVVGTWPLYILGITEFGGGLVYERKARFKIRRKVIWSDGVNPFILRFNMVQELMA